MPVCPMENFRRGMRMGYHDKSNKSVSRIKKIGQLPAWRYRDSVSGEAC
jgi:hypothetical protein